MSVTFSYTLIPTRARPVRRPMPVVEKRSRRFADDRVMHLLALGHRIQDMVEAGEMEDLAEAAIRLRRCRTRITQIVQLTQLAPDLQERVLTGQLNIAERYFRMALRSADWETQRATIARFEHDRSA
jgi:hypothetical protein